jgi:hypothetical protein
MLLMYDNSESFPPLDVCLLLRTHAEQLWLSRDTIPVLYQLQTPGGLPDEQLGAALAYLEVSWLEARRLALETEAAYAELEAAAPHADLPLPLQARRYHAAVRTLRKAIAERIDAVIAAPSDVPEPADRVANRPLIA